MDAETLLKIRDAEVARLEERVAFLEGALGLLELPPVEFGLTGKEARMFGALMKKEVCTKQTLMTALYNGQDEAEQKIVDVFVCKMRKKLKPFGVEIGTVWGQGYFISKAHKAIVVSMMAEAAA